MNMVMMSRVLVLLLVNSIHSSVVGFTSYTSEVADANLLNYVIQPTHIVAPGAQCFHPHITECPTEQLRALNLLQQYNYQISVVHIVNELGIHHAKRRCVATLLRRVQRMLYLPESALRWLLVVNQAKIELSVKEFTDLFRGLKEATTKSNSFPAFMYRQGDKFDSRRCDLHRWYTDILIRFAGRPVSAMNLRVVPKEYVSTESGNVNELILSPSLDILNEVIEIEKIRVHRGYPRKPRKKHYTGTRKHGSKVEDSDEEDLGNGRIDLLDQNTPENDNSNEQ